ncbi:uncharacterized protein LOC110682203 [Chenopodium quinoa]|uniref:uncharacterized protein LOC110682203 n=1 Tax=Chenopodium quinoa TaxID=63459 RepID=UPI000B770096|nr:uncharacterized protein LOC110682203 [Chenopodium quinoa]
MIMAPLPHFFKNVFFCYLLFISSSFLVFATSQNQLLPRRALLVKTLIQDDEDEIPKIKIKKSSPSSSTKNQTKPIIKSPPSSSKNLVTNNSSKKNQTKPILTTTQKTSSSSKNKTSSKNVGASPTLTKLNLNSTKSKPKPKPKTADLPKPKSSSSTQITKTPSSDPSKKTQKQKTTQKPPSMLNNNNDEEDYDFMAEFRDFTNKFHKTFIPDLHKFSTTSKIYLAKANNEITNNYIKPYVGKQYHSSASTVISFAFIILPFLLVSLLFNRITAYFSLQKLIIFIQIYLSIYFSILCFSSLITGLEPLRFFYVTSQSTYVWLQVLQTLGYVMYLLMLMMYLILVFSTESGLGQKFLGLAQTFVGFAIGFHYYMTVFHRAVLHQPPKTSWKVHGIYATCFLVICLFARADRTKKAYLDEEGVEEGKIN